MQTSMGQATTFGTGPFPGGRAESASSPNASTASTTKSASVSSNDFLQLLVTEMKNQDPTANTDPNEYINQLVQVNSLEQLIQINQELGGTSSASSDSTAGRSAANAPAGAANAATEASAGQTGGAPTGNLSLPGTSPAAARVAHALQVPSAAPSPADLQSIIHGPRSYTGALHNPINAAR